MIIECVLLLFMMAAPVERRASGRGSRRSSDDDRAARRGITFDGPAGVAGIETLRQRLERHPVGRALLLRCGGGDVRDLRIPEADFFQPALEFVVLGMNQTLFIRA
jgi:hypothetical protein